MARQLSELQSLPFHQIIGAPILAIVEGQAQSAQATAEFIERVGFKQKEDGEEEEIGDLRMVTFTYQKPDIDGEQKTYKLELPLLSIVPIPSIEVKEAEMEFNIKVADVQTFDVQSKFGDAEAETADWYSKKKVEFRASMGSMTASEGRKTDIQMNVKMKLEQGELPIGVQQLFRVMEQTINSEEQGSQIDAP
ncbi:DUF2589 domain-containing protein [Ekhidna sp. To15]|uniref:DUF2589 domain-containing protein n=1 Tax=Ekhidna sp. To15 TaxID=3395267 RepID=UPI003F52748D